MWSRSLSGEKRGFYFYERQSAILPRHSCPNCVVCLSAAAIRPRAGEEPKTFLSVKAVTVGQAMAAKAAARFHTFIWREQSAAQGAFTSVMLGSNDEWRAGRDEEHCGSNHLGDLEDVGREGGSVGRLPCRPSSVRPSVTAVG